MGSGFVQRTKDTPSVDQLSKWIGVWIVDKGGPAFIRPVGTGTVAIVGEFADMGFGVAVDASGVVTTFPKPVQIFGGNDMISKLGDFDPLLGDIGDAGGNGFLDLDGCAYAALVAVPVNLCSSRGIRLWRQLPTNRGATDPNPVVPISAGTVAASREFKSGANRVRTGTRVSFKQRDAYISGVDGSVTAVAGAATAGTETSSTGPFNILPGGVHHTDISINQGASQVFTWDGTPARCKMVAAGAYVGTVAGTFTIQWVSESGSHTQVVTLTSAATELGLIAQINDLLFQLQVPAYVEDSGDANKLQFKTTRFGTSCTVSITQVTGAGFTADTGINVTAVTAAGTALITKSGGTGQKTVTIAFLDVAKASEIQAAVTAADTLVGAVSTTLVASGAGATATLAITTLTAGASPDGVQVKNTSTNSLGFDNTEHNGTAAGSGSGPTNIFTAVGVSDWATTSVAKGDALVVGVIGAGGAQGSNAKTLRVVSLSGANLTVEMQDGTNFNWTTGASLAWRLHLWDVADSGGAHSFSEAGGYVVPARPLDATVAQGTILSPTVIPPALTASSADALSGLSSAVHPSGALTYTASVQAPNVTGTGLDLLYTSAINALLGEDDPQAGVDIAFASRSTQVIEAAGKTMTLTSYSHGHGRVWLQAPSLSTVDPIVAMQDAYPGVGFQRDDSVFNTWPGVNYFQSKAKNVSLKGADGNTYTDGNVDVSGKGNFASVLSVLLPERDPGEATPTTALGFQRVQGYQRGLTTSMNQDVFIALLAKGVTAFKWTKVNGTLRGVYHDGVTTSLVPGEQNIGVRRFKNYVQDSIAEALDPLAKQPISPDLREKAFTLQFNFFSLLKSDSDPKLARIKDFSVVVENDPSLEEIDVLSTAHQVRMFGIAKAILVTSEIGENVTVTATTGG